MADPQPTAEDAQLESAASVGTRPFGVGEIDPAVDHLNWSAVLLPPVAALRFAATGWAVATILLLGTDDAVFGLLSLIGGEGVAAGVALGVRFVWGFVWVMIARAFAVKANRYAWQNCSMSSQAVGLGFVDKFQTVEQFLALEARGVKISLILLGGLALVRLVESPFFGPDDVAPWTLAGLVGGWLLGLLVVFALESGRKRAEAFEQAHRADGVR